MEANLDYHSIRSNKARFYERNGAWLKIVSIVATVLLCSLGVLLFLMGQAMAWLVESLGWWALVLTFWVYFDLMHIKVNQGGQRVDDYLSADILGKLGNSITPLTLYQAALEARGGYFISSRLGVDPKLLQSLVSNDAAQVGVVYQTMGDIWRGLSEHSDVVTAPVVIAAILLNSPGVEDILRTHHVDYQDLKKVVEWYEHVSYLIEQQKKPRFTGGVARDWSFGYIPLLQHLGNSELESNRQIIDNMLSSLSMPGRQNVALIGPFGAGKSAIVDKFADILMDAGAKVPNSLKFNQVFSLDASAILSAASGRGEIENLINHLLVEAYRAKNIILFLDNAELFFEDGTGSVDISALLQPVIDGSGLKLIMSMNRQRFLQIAQAKPALANSLNRIEVQPASAEETMRVLEDNAVRLEYRSHGVIMYQALTEAIRLSDRYIYDVAQPRKSVQLLEQSMQQAVNGVVSAKSIAATIEKTLGIKVGGDLTYGDDQAERERLLNLEDLIHQRMINQKNAVTAVASALRRARAGVRNENRPIGTFLFLGPTGVGKTELAKSLAAVYFGGEDHMVRIDLNEYVRADDVARLIADGATDVNSLSAQVQKNPFSVVLLDEIEKAHPNVLTTLLQVLDEGVLRDINNREISFRDTIVIATSNAGADLIRQYIEAGYQIEQFSSQIQDQLINSGEFKPEFLNRFDEIAVFRPLTKDELLQVVNLILKGINKNLETQKIAVAVDEEGQRLLVDAGYDPRLGARPMRRIVQKTVENIVAEKMLTGELVPGAGIMLRAADIQASLDKTQ